MKKKMLVSLSLLTLCMGVTAQKVTVSDIDALPGETIAVALNLSEGKADTYTALTFEVVLPAEGFTTTGKYEVSSEWPNTTSGAGPGLVVFPFASSKPIAGSEVEGLITIYIKIDESVELGEYLITLKDIMFEYGLSSKDYADDVTFTVTGPPHQKLKTM